MRTPGPDAWYKLKQNLSGDTPVARRHKLKQKIERGHPSRFKRNRNKFKARTPQAPQTSKNKNSSEKKPSRVIQAKTKLKQGHPCPIVQTETKFKRGHPRHFKQTKTSEDTPVASNKLKQARSPQSLQTN